MKQKPDRANTSKENWGSITCTNINAKILNQIFASTSQECTKMIIPHHKVGFISETQLWLNM
jgi:hypothetical protein